MSNDSILALRIKELRSSMKLTQKEFADALNVSTVSISSYETGAKTPSLDMVINIAKKYNISIDWLCGLSSEKQANRIYTTYYDILRVLVNLCSTEYEDKIEHKQMEYVEPVLHPSSDNIHFIIREDNLVNSFFKNWKKMYSLLQDNTINDDIYTQWLDGQLAIYKNHPIDKLPF